MFNKIKKNHLLLSFSILAVGLICVALLRNILVNDYHWHVKAGEWIVQHKTVPKTGIYSWYGENLPWTAHEWLFEVIIYAINKTGGALGTFLYSLLTGLIMMAILLFNVRKDLSKNAVLILPWIILSVMSINFVASPRPHMLMFILASLMMMLLYHFKRNPDTKLIYTLPLISLAWANIHGGSSNLSYVLPLLLLLTSLVDYEFFSITLTKLPYKKLVLLGGLTAVSILMLLINPYGFEMLKYPYVNMADSLMLAFISEWASPDAKITQDVLMVFAPIVLHVVIYTVRNKKIQAEDVLYTLFFTYLTLRSGRFVYFIFLIQSLVLFKDIQVKLPKRYDALFSGMVFILGVMFILLPLKMNRLSGTFEHPVISDEMLKVVEGAAPEKLLNDYDYGGYLIYNEIPVYIDGRADMYSKNNLSAYAKFIRNNIEDLEDYIRQMQFDYILMDKKWSIVNMLKTQDYLEIILEDEHTIFMRVLSEER